MVNGYHLLAVLIKISHVITFGKSLNPFASFIFPLYIQKNKVYMPSFFFRKEYTFKKKFLNLNNALKR